MSPNSSDILFQYSLISFLQCQDLLFIWLVSCSVSVFVFCMNTLLTALLLSFWFTTTSRAVRKGFLTQLYRILKCTFQHVQLELLLPCSFISLATLPGKTLSSPIRDSFIYNLAFFQRRSFIVCLYYVAYHGGTPQQKTM